MTREEILEKARKENNGVDEVKRSVEADATKISQAVGLCACMFFNFMDSIFLQTEVIGSICWIIYGIIVTTNLWVHAACLKKTGYLVGALITTVFVILLTVFLFLG